MGERGKGVEVEVGRKSEESGELEGTQHSSPVGRDCSDSQGTGSLDILMSQKHTPRMKRKNILILN